jgi:hypothetical protein
MPRIPRSLKVGFFRAIELLVLRTAGRRRKIDRFNWLIERDVRETVNILRSVYAEVSRFITK